MTDYDKGLIDGYNSLIGDYPNQNMLHNSEYIRGWKDGIKKIDNEADEAFQAQYSMNG